MRGVWLRKRRREPAARAPAGRGEARGGQACGVSLPPAAPSQTTPTPPEKQKWGLRPVPLLGSWASKSCTLRRGGWTQGKGTTPPGAAPMGAQGSAGFKQSFSPNSLLCSGHGLQGRKNPGNSADSGTSQTEAAKRFRSSHRNRLWAPSLQSIPAEERSPSESARASPVQLRSNPHP